MNNSIRFTGIILLCVRQMRMIQSCRSRIVFVIVQGFSSVDVDSRITVCVVYVKCVWFTMKLIKHTSGSQVFFSSDTADIVLPQGAATPSQMFQRVLKIKI